MSDDFMERYDRHIDDASIAEFAESFKARLSESRRTGVPMSYGASRSDEKPHAYTNEERLAYYRSHGLVSCDDYPGGDAAFEADVLSGDQHDFKVVEGPPKREDAYVIQCMYDGRFKYDSGITDFIRHPELSLAFYDTCRRNGIAVSYNYPGGPVQFREDVLSGVYACRRVEARRKAGLE